MPTLHQGFRISSWLRRACAAYAIATLSAQGAIAATGGAGASLPYVEIQAENAATTGTVLPVTYTYNTVGGEASGRRAVTLDAVGEFVEFTLPSSANSIVVRYSIPDSSSGAPYNAPLGVFINDQRQPTDLTLTNTYSHYYGSYPFNNNPGSGNHHHFYDEVSTLLPAMQAGARVRLQMVSTAASSITIDLADFEQAATAAGAPANSIAVVADTTGQADATGAINQAIAQAAGRVVWIPAGRYLVNGRIMVNNVTIRGAGMWHTVLNFSGQGENTGFHGSMPPNVSSGVNISDLRMNGNIQERNDGAQTNAFGGGMSNSTIANVWIEHFKCGAWMFGPATNLRFTGVRMRDTNADAINFNGGFTNSHVTQSHLRNNGDDSLAMWSYQSPDVGNSFTFNTIELPLLANGIAIYGGSNNTVTDNRIVDAGLSQGGGIHVGNRFQAPPLGGTTTIARNTVIRSGNLDPNWNFGVGAIWFDSRDTAMNGVINVTDLLIQQSPYSAIMFVSGNGSRFPVTNVSFNDVTVQGVGTFVLQIQDPGSATFQNVVASNIGRAGIWDCLGSGQFTVGNGGGNDTWISSTLCSGTPPTPVFPPPVGGLSVNPTAVNFGSQAVGVSGTPRTVTVSNSGSSAAPIGSIVASGGNGDFSQANNCGASIPANGSCTVNVVFTPTVAGSRTGSLAINSSVGNSTVALSGNGTAPGAVIAASPSTLTFAGTVVGNTSGAQTVQLTNTGTVAATISAITTSGDFARTTTCGSTLAVNASCSVGVTFTPTVQGSRSGTLTVTGNANNSPTTVSLSGSGISANTNVAAGRPADSSGVSQDYVPSRAADGNANAPSYWESANNAFPQWLQIDLGAATAINRIVLKLPPAWEARTQTLAVQGSNTGTGTFTTIVAAAGYPFNPANSNIVELNFNTVTTRYVRLNFTANTAWPAGQISEFEIYSASASVATLAASPTSLAFGDQAINTSLLRTVTITNTGSAAGSVASVNISGQFTQTHNCAALAAGASCTVSVAFTPTTVGAKTGTLTVNSNASNPSLTAALSGNGTNTAPPTNQASGRQMTSSPPTFSFVAGNANDGNLTTYWESAFPAWLNVAMVNNVKVSQVIVRLNPDAAWGTRMQTFSIEGRDQAGGNYVTLVGAAQYTFNPAAAPAGNGNTVTIDVPGTAPAVADLRLSFTANTGAPGGQVAELQVNGVLGPNPDLTVSGVTASPASVNETTPVTVSATVTNTGTAPTPSATNVKAYCGTTQVGPAANVPVLQAGASQSVSMNVGPLPAGTCAVSARVDDPSTIVEQNESNNSAAGPTLTVGQAPGPDLQVLGVTSSPSNPAVGAAVTFVVSVNNRGTDAVAAGSTTRVTVGATTLNDTNSPAIAAGATVNVTIPGSWAATNGGTTITASADATNIVSETNENNNSFSRSIVVGRGAAVPYVELEAESANYQGVLLVADAERTFGHTNFASESSGRQSVRLNSTGQFVEFTATSAANSIVVRNSIPDASGGGGTEATISLYVTQPGGAMAFVQKLTLSSRHSWLYGTTDETDSLSNSPGPDARRLFDESHALLPVTYPVGTRYRLQRDGNDAATFYIIDLIDLELVAPPLSQPANCTSITTYGATPNDNTDDTAAIQRAVMDDQNGVIQCVWIPQGRWRQEQKILTPDPTRGQFNQLGIRNVVIRGAGMWHTELYTTTEPQNVVGNINHPHEGNVGFEIEDNVQISDLAISGMTTNRSNRGHGLNGRFGANSRFSNLWIEHVNVGAWVGRDFSDTPAYWNPGNGLDFSGMRIRNTFADGINLSNGTRSSRVFNSHFRNTGDDSVVVWANPYVRDQAADVGRDNRLMNNTVQLPWRANGIAIYGGANNSIENNLVYDTMTFPGIMLATDHSPLPFSGTTLVANNGLFRCGGLFWNEDQRYGAITLFPSGQPIVGAVIRDTDIFDSTYDGIQFKTGGGEMPNVTITNVRIDDSNNGGAGILAMSGARGNATLSNVTISNSAGGDVGRNPGSQFVFSGTVNGAPVQPVVVP